MATQKRSTLDYKYLVPHVDFAPHLRFYKVEENCYYHYRYHIRHCDGFITAEDVAERLMHLTSTELEKLHELGWLDLLEKIQEKRLKEIDQEKEEERQQLQEDIASAKEFEVFLSNWLLFPENRVKEDACYWAARAYIWQQRPLDKRSEEDVSIRNMHIGAISTVNNWREHAGNIDQYSDIYNLFNNFNDDVVDTILIEKWRTALEINVRKQISEDQNQVDELRNNTEL